MCCTPQSAENGMSKGRDRIVKTTHLHITGMEPNGEVLMRFLRIASISEMSAFLILLPTQMARKNESSTPKRQPLHSNSKKRWGKRFGNGFLKIRNAARTYVKHIIPCLIPPDLENLMEAISVLPG